MRGLLSHRKIDDEAGHLHDRGDAPPARRRPRSGHAVARANEQAHVGQRALARAISELQDSPAASNHITRCSSMPVCATVALQSSTAASWQGAMPPSPSIAVMSYSSRRPAWRRRKPSEPRMIGLLKASINVSNRPRQARKRWQRAGQYVGEGRRGVSVRARVPIPAVRTRVLPLRVLDQRGRTAAAPDIGRDRPASPW